MTVEQADHSMVSMSAVKDLFEAVFRRPLSVWSAALLLGTLNILLFALEKPWTVSDGFRNWGDWVFQTSGLQSPSPIFPPWLYSGSVLNIGLLAGALTSSLLSRQLAVRMAPPRELGKGFAGGLLMGTGAVCAMGCNIGGFYSAISAFSLSGLTMMVGLIVGAYLGSRYLRWEGIDRVQVGLARNSCVTPSTSRTLQPWLGGACLVLIAAAVMEYENRDLGQRGVLLVFGALLGIVLQRSRFCFERAFCEPFLSGASEMTRAAALSLGVSAMGFAVLKSTDLRSVDTFVSPSFWQGSLAGGTIFGVGMALAGGCAASSIWRAAEGNVKLWCAVIGFAAASSFTRHFLEQIGLLGFLGSSILLPDFTGWPLALALTMAVLGAWYLSAAWNEKTRIGLW
ncbi:MAG: YeeE/YedE family protein [Acidobacteria bacterium]|nr:YeeE/YedE family protein [Acidobacteriota bacterium]